MRPTPEEIAEARERFDYLSFDKASVRELEAKLDSILGKDATKHIRVLLAATEPHMDERTEHALAKIAGAVRETNETHNDIVKAVTCHFFGLVKP